MAHIVYLLCGLMSTVCAALLLRGYLSSKTKLLLWSGLCFSFLAITNIILVIDLVVLPEVDFSGVLLRNITGAIAGALMLFGLIWELT